MQILHGAFLLGCVAFLAAANVFAYHAILAPRVLTVTALGMGKGSATLVRAPDGRTLLVDAGPDASILRALGETLPVWQRKIDAVILTCAKTACIGGLPEVESRYRVSTVVHLGDRSTAYGAPLLFDGSARITIPSPGALVISYGATVLSISSSTPPGTYVSDGNVLQREDAGIISKTLGGDAAEPIAAP